MTVNEEALRHGRTIWEYLVLGHHPLAADVIVVLGTNDVRVADHAAEMYRRGYGQMIVFSGGIAHVGDLLATGWDRSEAEVFADRAAELGVPRDVMLLEGAATNTSENIRLSRRLLESRGIRPKNILLVTKPFMQRRTWASMAVEWPEMPGSISSPAMGLDDYFTDDLTPDKVLNIMMGDLQRIWVYGRKGWQAAQRVPAQVREAFDALVQLGYTRQLISED